MRWFLVALLCLAGCGKSEPAKPSAADYQAELAELERLEKDFQAASNNLSGLRQLKQATLENASLSDQLASEAATEADRKKEQRAAVESHRRADDVAKKIDAAEEKIRHAESALNEQKARVEIMRKERRN